MGSVNALSTALLGFRCTRVARYPHDGAMRLLFTCTGGSGHFLPAIPIARAAVARGNTVAFSAQEMMLGAVEAAGFPAPQLEMLHRYLTLVPVPPTYRTPGDPLPATARHIRPAVLDSTPMPAQHDASGTLVLDWLHERSGRPTVYFTLGTVFHQESGDLFSRVVAGLRELDANIIVTVGREIDPAELGHQPANVRVDRFVRQDSLLPHCDVVVSHAGSGSVIGALAFGVPLVLLPMGADQPLNADRCKALGVARVLDPITVSSGDVHLAVIDVLRAPSYRDAVTRIQHEIAELPTSADAATWIEDLSRADPSR